jgi:alkaline phosphatase
MKKLVKITIAMLVFMNTSIAIYGQKRVYTVANAHAHNDYANSVPFYYAYEKGFASVEADVFVVDGKLMVAHNLKEIVAKRSLKIMYIDPLAVKLAKDLNRHIILLIDIKQDYHNTIPLVIKELKPLMKYALAKGLPGRLKVIMTGAVPPATELNNYPKWLQFDVNHLAGFTPKQLKRVGLLSFRFSNYTKWIGNGPMPAADYKRVASLVDSVHAAKKPIRFWETTDNEITWQTLERLNVDFIGTDEVKEFSEFLNKK